MKKVLVTGSDGFIGSHLVEGLVAEGCNVRAMVLYNSFNSWGWVDSFSDKTKRRIEVVAGDVRDYGSVKAAVDGCDTVLHLAALIAIPYSYSAPESYVDTNINGTLNILRSSQECGVKKIIHTSTSEVYGTAQYVPIDEKHPLNAQSPYAATKIGADQLAMSFHCSFGLPVCIVRPFNTFGPRQSARAVIPTVITQIAAEKTEIRLGSLSPKRDFNYIEDTVGGFIAAAKSSKSVGEVINIGSGHNFTVGETVEMIAEIMGKKIKIFGEKQRIRPERSEVEVLLCDNSKAKKLLGWSPKYGGRKGFIKALEKTVAWFIEPENLRNYKADIYNK